VSDGSASPVAHAPGSDNMLRDSERSPFRQCSARNSACAVCPVWSRRSSPFSPIADGGSHRLSGFLSAPTTDKEWRARRIPALLPPRTLAPSPPLIPTPTPAPAPAHCWPFLPLSLPMFRAEHCFRRLPPFSIGGPCRHCSAPRAHRERLAATAAFPIVPWPPVLWGERNREKTVGFREYATARAHSRSSRPFVHRTEPAFADKDACRHLPPPRTLTSNPRAADPRFSSTPFYAACFAPSRPAPEAWRRCRAEHAA
jgi:hypothetical protein